MRVLITGGTGLLGKALIERNGDGHQIWAVYLGKYNIRGNKGVAYYNTDVCKIVELENIFSEAMPDLVIHTAGIADVEYCEKNYDAARRSNVMGTENVLALCKKYNSKIVYVSTNAVFDGRNAPYSEEDAPHPVNNYGSIKLECERQVREANVSWLIVRPILMYGWNNKNERLNLVTWLLNKLQNGEKVNMVIDVYENPLLNHNCAEVIWSLIRFQKEGIFHIGGKDVVNRYEFSRAVAEVFNLGGKDSISPVTSNFFSGIAPRPPNTSYNLEKMSRELNLSPLGLKAGLLCMKQDRPNGH